MRPGKPKNDSESASRQRPKSRSFMVSHWKSSVITLSVVIVAVVAGGIAMGMYPGSLSDSSPQSNMMETDQKNTENQEIEPKPNAEPDQLIIDDQAAPLSVLNDRQNITPTPKANQPPKIPNKAAKPKNDQPACDESKKQAITKEYNDNLKAEYQRYKNAVKRKSVLSNIFPFWSSKISQSKDREESKTHKQNVKKITHDYKQQLQNASCQ